MVGLGWRLGVVRWYGQASTGRPGDTAGETPAKYADHHIPSFHCELSHTYSPSCPEIIRQRSNIHDHKGATSDACHACPIHAQRDRPWGIQDQASKRTDASRGRTGERAPKCSRSRGFGKRERICKVVARALPLSKTWTTTLNAVSSNMLVGAQQHQMQRNDRGSKIVGANLHWDAIGGLGNVQRYRCREVLPGINGGAAVEEVKIVHGDITEQWITHQRRRYGTGHARVGLCAPTMEQIRLCRRFRRFARNRNACGVIFALGCS